ncbi:MAG TPA: phosphoribosylaminoimidazolesuccinocarboxamide synthase [Candidatus Margulisiibacteriota bacterium]|nr:phosphoribosylaminoimidazolesuccinocarboxamide synthase [Candidatus Margulisiibacteriota bacterium]
MEKRELIYEGKAKRVYTTDNPDLVIQYFKDDATAFNAKKRGTILEKGIVNNELSETFFRLLEREGIPTHFVERLNEREMLVKRLDIIPVETVVRNIIAGSLAKRLGLQEGKSLPAPIVEYYYKNDALDDPMINQWHVTVLGMATEQELTTLTDLAVRINDILRTFLQSKSILLVDFKLEFGRHHGQILLGDEICPDTCRLWDAATRKKLDKDRFRQDLGEVEEAYHEVHRRVCSAA